MEIIHKNQCRICLTECKEFDSDVDSFRTLYKTVTGHIVKDDDIPKKVCTNCQNILLHFKDFIEKCNESERILEDHQMNSNPFTPNSSELELKFSPAPVEIKIEPLGDLIEPELMTQNTVEVKNSHRSRQKPSPRLLCCELCGKQVRGDVMKKHLLMHEEKSRKTALTCDICGATYYSKEIIRRHMCKKHLNLKKYDCAFCEKSYTDTSNLKAHVMYRHTHNFPVVCEICGKGFHTKSKLEIHQAKHTDIRKYPCNICGDAFKSKHYLSRHKRDVHSNRNIECQECNKSFKCQKLLNSHLRTHRPREYICPVCSHTFAVSQTLRNHITKTHPDLTLPPPGTNLRNLTDLNSYLMLCSTTSSSVM